MAGARSSLEFTPETQQNDQADLRYACPRPGRSENDTPPGEDRQRQPLRRLPYCPPGYQWAAVNTGRFTAWQGLGATRPIFRPPDALAQRAGLSGHLGSALPLG